VLTEFGVKIAPSTYYAALDRPESDREKCDKELIVEIERIHEGNYSVCGAKKIWKQLNREGIEVGRGRVARLMRRAGPAGALRGRRVWTTVSDKDGVRAADLVERQFAAGAPNRLRVAGFAYAATWSGAVCVAFCIDVFSRGIVGWKVGVSEETAFVLDTVETGLRIRRYRPPEDGVELVHHSDAGGQCTSFKFTRHLVDSGVDASIGTVGDAYDDAMAESAIGLCKTELIKPSGPWHDKK
jgi:putative transposase